MIEMWTNTAMIVVDMQKDYVGPGTAPFGQAVLPCVIKAVDIARQHGVLVVWAVREHDRLGRDVELFRRRNYGRKKHGEVVRGTKGAELADGLVITGDDYKLVKTRFSAFHSTNLHSFFQAVGVKNLVVVGVQTPNCIRETVFDAVALDYENITVITDATGAYTPEIHAANILDMKNVGVATPTLKEWCQCDA
ncbi:hypothetical protein MKW94_013878 [Papaver nudicaule]|uniref:Isochorismatase-like domain-containing protein n=1 Tax=Papaver nudicaule TaxID=74823 RepID=A0AA41VN64_PAPNU|nr:hypothetical protein [Papaver nudicaule]